jgi:hypothetical protein
MFCSDDDNELLKMEIGELPHEMDVLVYDQQKSERSIYMLLCVFCNFGEICNHCVVASYDVMNPYAYFGEPTLWPRGYPLVTIKRKYKLN